MILPRREIQKFTQDYKSSVKLQDHVYRGNIDFQKNELKVNTLWTANSYAIQLVEPGFRFIDLVIFEVALVFYFEMDFFLAQHKKKYLREGLLLSSLNSTVFQFLTKGRIEDSDGIRDRRMHYYNDLSSYNEPFSEDWYFSVVRNLAFSAHNIKKNRKMGSSFKDDIDVGRGLIPNVDLIEMYAQCSQKLIKHLGPTLAQY